MADRPIHFSAPMVRALLDGRKTQTRRVIKPQPEWVADGVMYWRGKATTVHGHRCPYGRPGDRMWVREAWAAFIPIPGIKYYKTGVIKREPIKGGVCPFQAAREVVYRADGEDVTQNHPHGATGKWHSPVHMPRWASRLTLVVTEVRVQRLQEISHDDAIAEGIEGEGTILEPAWYDYESPIDFDGRPSRVFRCPTRSFASLWDSLHDLPGERWSDNPWVAALTFTVHQRNIDELRQAAIAAVTEEDGDLADD